MKREIKFRAKSIPNGKFVYGMPLPSSFGCGYMLNIEDALGADFYHSRYTMPRCSSSVPIDEDTIGQFTGLKCFDGPDDKEGTEIYEGDIIRINRMANKYNVVSVVENVSGSFMVKDMWPLSKYASTCKVIGNIYDNPELLNK